MAAFESDDIVASVSFFKNENDYELHHPLALKNLDDWDKNYLKRNADNIPYYILYRLGDIPCEGKVEEERMFSFESYISHYQQLKEITEQINKNDNLNNKKNILKFVNTNEVLTSLCKTNIQEENENHAATNTKYENEIDFLVDHPKDLTNINLQNKNKESIPFYLLYSPSEMFFKTFTEYKKKLRYLSYLDKEFIPRLQAESQVKGHQKAMASCEEKKKDVAKSITYRMSSRKSNTKNSKRSRSRRK